MKVVAPSPLFAPPHETPFLWGYDGIVSRLGAQLQCATLPPVMLLHGPQGIGKATLGYHLARMVLGAQDTNSALWHRVSEGTHPDFWALKNHTEDGVAQSAWITIEQVRDALVFLRRHKSEGPARVVLVDAVDHLNRSGVNALLKTLEEPRPKTFLILISHHPYHLLPTLRSRCYGIRCRPLSRADFQDALCATAIAPETHDLYWAYSSGRLGWVSALHQYGGDRWFAIWSDAEIWSQKVDAWIEEARQNPDFLIFLTTWVAWWIRDRLRTRPLSKALYKDIQNERDILAAITMIRTLNADARQALIYIFNRLRTMK